MSPDFMLHERYLSGDEVREMTNIDTDTDYVSLYCITFCFN